MHSRNFAEFHDQVCKALAGAVNAWQGGGVDQAYDGWWVVSQFKFQKKLPFAQVA
jgi:hypothetical protein